MNEDRLIKSANYVRTELPVRIAHRLRDMQALPYVVVTNEGVTKVYEVSTRQFHTPCIYSDLPLDVLGCVREVAILPHHTLHHADHGALLPLGSAGFLQ